MSGRYSKYILKSIKEKFGVEEKYETEGFPDLNYEVGNTSGLDVAPGVPSAMDERIGSLSQRGGSVMEVIINNPATFQLDKDRMFNVINQLGINISIHSNPDVGYTNPNRQAGGGYDPTHAYFTRYLEQFAIFKKEAEVRAKDEENFGFEIQRINPHISTSRLPALEEERPGDTGLDPFGYSLTDLKEEVMDEKDEKGQNIYRNKEFLRRFYKVFMSEEVFGDREYQYYQNFTSFSPRFDKEWRRHQNEIAEDYFNIMTGQNGTSLEEKADVVSAVANTDPAITRQWLELLEDEEFDDVPIPSALRQRLQGIGIDSISNLEDLDTFIRAALSQRYRLSELRTLSDLLYFLKNKELNRIRSRPLQMDGLNIDESFQNDLWDEIEDALENALDDLWTEEAEEDDERKISLIPVEAKVGGLTQQLEIPQGKIQEEAFQRNKDELSDEVEKMFAGDEEMFEHRSDEEIKAKDQHKRFLRTFIRNFQQQIWMESNIMYRIIPAWMSVADKKIENEDGDVTHKGWDAPKFVWELLVKRKWEDKKGYDIDLTDPRGEDGETGYLDLLENNREFQADVAAASAACYVWGHFTQKEGHFSIENEEYVDDVQTDTTWIEWMNKFGIGVNFEAMPGSPQQMYKIWRPKDIVAAARAVNITARNELGEIHEDLDGMPAKFTIDLEHTATFGLDPWKTMDELIKQEKDLAESDLAVKYNLKVDGDKPLAKVLRMWHLMRAGLETSQSQTLHGPWDRGDTQLYEWLYKMVDAGFARNPDEIAYIMYEVGGDDRGTVYTARIAMNLIELGVEPKDLDPINVDPSKKEYGDEKEALMARFFGMDKSSYDREWAKIEEHAFDPLDGLLEAEQFDYTWSSQAAIENDNRPQDWMQEEFK